MRLRALGKKEGVWNTPSSTQGIVGITRETAGRAKSVPVGVELSGTRGGGSRRRLLIPTWVTTQGVTEPGPGTICQSPLRSWVAWRGPGVLVCMLAGL